MTRMTRYTCAALLLCCAAAGAQGQDMREEMKKRMEEISRLMRDSERLLKEITKVDRLVAKQQEIVRKLKELEPPPQNANSEAAADREKQRQKLKQSQEDVARKLSELFDGQKQRGEMTVLQLEQLLKNWPRDQKQGQGQPQKKSKQQRERERRLREKQKEQKQNQPDSARKKKDPNKPKGSSRRPPDKTQEARRLRRIEAWLVRLPPEVQERINRGNLSDIPVRYKRLVREYTALRAKREAEAAEEDR